MLKILRSLRNVAIHIRSSLKLILMILISGLLICGIISVFYKPTYAVTLNGEFIGYTNDKSALQEAINEQMNGVDEKNIAFVDIETLPEYSLCFVKRNTEDSSEKILENIKDMGTTYYRYYAIMLKDEEKYYVSTKTEAEEIIDTLKSKNSNNIKDIAYTEKYNTEPEEFTDQETIVSALYVKKVTPSYSSGSYAIASAKIDLGINLIAPISSGYTITSRFGPRASGNHTGLDIAAPTGTSIRAAASGTAIYVGWSNVGYGNHIIIDHGNGVHTLYGHCSELYVTEGQYINQGDVIAAVGSTGNSTGPHLHLEIRVNGTRYNPQYYLY